MATTAPGRVTADNRFAVHGVRCVHDFFDRFGNPIDLRRWRQQDGMVQQDRVLGGLLAVRQVTNFAASSPAPQREAAKPFVQGDPLRPDGGQELVSAEPVALGPK